jgi:catechol 2,3-dioxygenase-like lactoylglutathione lyase family enzyme
MAADRKNPLWSALMQYEAIDHVVLATESVAGARKTFERLGFWTSPVGDHAEAGLEMSSLAAGGPDNFFLIILAGVVDEQQAARSPLGRMALAARTQGDGLFDVGLQVSDLDRAVKELRDKGAGIEIVEMDGLEGTRIALLDVQAKAGVPLSLVQYSQTAAELHAVFEKAGALAHALSLTRLDHLASSPQDYDGATRYWNETLGIPTWGELVGGSGNKIRQMQIGDAIIELIGAAGAESPVRSRRPGLSSMTAFEVPDLDAAVGVARSRGFSVSDPVIGSLPGTRVARIPADELCGLGLQLLQYV